MIKHIGVFVNNHALCANVLEHIGFYKIYDEQEYFRDRMRRITKWDRDGYVVELIDGDHIPENTYHLCFDGDVPKQLLHFGVLPGKAKNPDIKLSFVHIGDSLYFEFSRAV